MDALIWVLIAGVVIALAIGAYLFMKRSRSGSAEKTYLHFRCPGCKRRLRFQASQTGHSGQCSHCGGKLTFPSASQASD
jgi:hypothetical protein